MITRISVSSFRCFDEFDLSPGPLNVLLGENGSGKSTVFEVLRKLQEFVSGRQLAQRIFSEDDTTAWETSSTQLFTLNIEGPEGMYDYRTAIEFTNTVNQPVKVVAEQLRYNRYILFRRDKGTDCVDVMHDDNQGSTTYPHNPIQSIFMTLPEHPEMTRITWFKKRLQRIILVQITPKLISSTSPREADQLNAGAENFVSWYRYISHNQGILMQIATILTDVLPGFAHFNFDKAGPNHRILSACFFTGKGRDTTIQPYRFDQLSDGQRALIVLYSILYYAQGEDYTICIDEPANFLALSEVQPWLTRVEDFCQDGNLQALLISHHPEIIDHIASSSGYWFSRGSNESTQVKPLPEHDKQGVPRSELIARGWLDA